MASAAKYFDQKAGARGAWRWRGRYYDAGGKRRSRSRFETKAQAIAWAGAEEGKILRGQRSDPAAAKMRWSEWCDRWLESKAVEPRSLRTLKSSIDVHVRPRWGSTPLVGIARIDVQGWVNKLARERSASTAKKAFYALSNSLQAAVVEGILAASPCVGITLPTNPSSQERFLTDVEAGRILYHLDGRYRVLAELLLGTGLRIAEAAGLHVARLDVDRKRLQVVETYDPEEAAAGVDSKGVMRGYPKSKRRREVPLSPELADLLQAHLDARPPGASCGKPHRAGRCPGGLVFSTERGTPIDCRNFAKREWAAAVRLAGLENVKVHDTRHTYASRLVQLGVPLERVQLLLGHEDLKTTQRYAWLVPTDDWDSVRAALSTSLTAARAAAVDGPVDGPDARPNSPEPTGTRRRMRAV